MRTFFGIVIILLSSSVFWLTYLWLITRKQYNSKARESVKENNVKDTNKEQRKDLSTMYVD